MISKSSENTRSQDFRYVFANTIGMTFGPTEVQLIFGIQKQTGSDDPSMEEQVGLVVTHPAAKLLAHMIGAVMADYEEATGTVVPIDPAKIAQLQTMLDDAKRKRAEAAAKPDTPPPS